MRSCMPWRPRKFSPMRILSSTIAHKKTIHIGSALLREVILSITRAMPLSGRWTSILQRSTGTAWLARRMQNTCAWISIFLSHRIPQIFWIHENCPLVIPQVGTGAVQFEEMSPRRMGIHWDATPSLGLTSSRHSCQQATTPQTCTIRLHREHQHTGVVDTQIPPYFIHPCRWWLWREICHTGQCRPLKTDLNKTGHKDFGEKKNGRKN